MKDEIDDLKNMMPYRIVNKDGHGKSVSQEDWIYLGTHITIPQGCFAIIYAFRGWSNGQPLGAKICGREDGTNVYAIRNPESDPDHSMVSVTAVVGAGTFYFLSKAKPGKSSEQMEAIIFKNIQLGVD